jgi:hypothetical protein
MSNLVHNERMKLMATFFNNIAVASLVTGFVVPLINLVTAPGSIPRSIYEISVSAGIALSMLFVGCARGILGNLKE